MSLVRKKLSGRLALVIDQLSISGNNDIRLALVRKFAVRISPVEPHAVSSIGWIEPTPSSAIR